MTRDEVVAALNAQARAWEAGDVDAIMAHYAPDAILIAPATHLIGAAAIRASFANYLITYAVRRITLTRVILDDGQGTQGADSATGALEWTWGETRHADNQQNTIDDAIIFTLRADKIIHWREYFDTTTHA